MAYTQLMNSLLCFTMFSLFCTIVFTNAVSEKKSDCNSRIEVVPPEATTHTGMASDDPLQVTCITQLPKSPSSFPRLLSLTVGLLREAETDKSTGGQNRKQDEKGHTQQTVNDTGHKTRPQSQNGQSGLTSKDAVDRNRMHGTNGQQSGVNNRMQSINGKGSREQNSIQTPREQRGTGPSPDGQQGGEASIVAQLLVHTESSDGQDWLESLPNRVQLSTPSENGDISARIRFVGSSLRVEVLLKKASFSCSSFADHPFYCSAISSRIIAAGTTCTERLEEVVVSQPLFVRNCDGQPYWTRETLGFFPSMQCYQSSNFTDPGQYVVDSQYSGARNEVDNTGGRKKRESAAMPDGGSGVPQVNDHLHDTDDRDRSFMEGSGQYMISKSSEDQAKKERLTAYMIMSISFTGGFLAGIILAGVCWFMRLSHM